MSVAPVVKVSMFNYLYQTWHQLFFSFLFHVSRLHLVPSFLWTTKFTQKAAPKVLEKTVYDEVYECCKTKLHKKSIWFPNKIDQLRFCFSLIQST